MILLLFFAFLAGFVTILAPCIWPILPIVLSSSISGQSHKRPLGVVTGIIISFTFFTLSISYLVGIFKFDPEIFRILAVLIIAFLGLSLVIPRLSAVLEGFVSRLSSRLNTGQNTNSDFLSGFITGLSLGIIWTPCAGPILATIATLAATGQVTIEVFLVTLSYALGVAIPLFILALAGQKFLLKTRVLSAYTGRIQQFFGALMILTAFAIYLNFDKTLQVIILDRLPFLNTVVTGFEDQMQVKQQLSKLKGEDSSQNDPNFRGITSGIAPEFAGIEKWLNTDKEIKLSDLKGKVVYVDFWTYSCINCIRTLPHIIEWQQKYGPSGFQVVGIHSPEFQFEKKTANVEAAIKSNNINYPVGQDNKFETWKAYQNVSWPAGYLVDTKGEIRHTHFGEYGYEETELAIQKLLIESGNDIPQELSKLPDIEPQIQESPETYLGSKRMQFRIPDEKILNGAQKFTLNEKLPENKFSFGGNWDIGEEYSTSGNQAIIAYHFYANKVYITLKPQILGSKIKVYIDGNPISPDIQGSDVQNGFITVDEETLYEVINIKGVAQKHILRLEFEPGIQIYTFTFG